MSRARLVAILFVLFLMLSFVPCSPAQITGAGDIQATPMPGVGHDYIKMLSETVQPSNGQLSIRIDVPTRGGRGGIPYAYFYNSAGVHHVIPTTPPGRAEWVTDISDTQGSGWSDTYPRITAIKAMASNNEPGPPPYTASCVYFTNYVFQDSSGARHPLALQTAQSNDGVSPNHCSQVAGGGPTNSLTGGDGYMYVANTSAPPVDTVPTNPPPVTIVGSDGTFYSCGQLGLIGSGPTAFYESGCGTGGTDRNGNGLLAQPSISVTTTSETVPWQAFSFNYVTDSIPQANCFGINPVSPGQMNVYQSINFPNGKSYVFSYDPVYGLVNQITYPTGGYTTYVWNLAPRSQAIQTSDNTGLTCEFEYDAPVITNRYVSFDGVNIALEQDFQYPTPQWSTAGNGADTWLSKQTIVITKDCARNNFNCTGAPSFTTTYNYVGPGGVGSQNAVETSIVYGDFNGNTLLTETKGWSGPALLCDLKTLNNGLTSGAFYTYGPNPYGFVALVQITDKKEYDYGLITSTSACPAGGAGAPPGITPTSDIVTNYASFAATPYFPYTPSILDRPSSVITYSGSSTSGTRVAETDYGYDETAVSAVSPAPWDHDNSTYSASYNNRGNLTTLTQQCFNGSCAGGNSKRTYTYDETGQVLSMTDPCGNASCSDISDTNHTTIYSYMDNFDSPPSGNTSAYLTKITRPTTSSGAAHVQTFKYSYADGQLIASTDENGQTTQYFYNDSLRRLTETDYPDTGKTTITYNDAPYNPSTPSPSVTTMQVATPDPSIVTLTAFDGLGHTVRGVITSDPDCTNGDRTDTTYDGLGRVYTVSNPYCNTGDSTYGLTTYAYDALGRTKQVSEPDGSIVTTFYSGNTTTVTDEAGKKRQSTNDALGRLTQVTEDPGGLGYVTNYTYDALNNLLTVVQNGSRQRTFAYDSLSRLTSATNPESSGPTATTPTTYSYDANGNLTGKTDARNVSVGYSYDALNRLTAKTYSDSTNPVYFWYDQTNPWGLTLTNPIGRLTTVGTYDGTCYSTASTFGHDAMGRPSFQEDYLNKADTSGCPGAWSFVSASYDLAGNQTSLTYPSGRVVKSQFNGASRLTKTYVDDFNSYNYLSSASYSPFGSPTTFALGNGAIETSTYDNRLQPLSQQVANNSSTLLNHTYNFSPGHNNGNVLSITDNLNSSLTQNFSYDPLNRLYTAQTAGTSGADCWGQQFGYDPWGNLTTETPNVPGCPTNMLSLGINASNQITNTGFTYDAAGNLTADGTGTGSHTYTFDAENRITQVNGGSTANYTYDAEGRRMGKKIGSATTEYIYFNGDVLAEYNLGDQLWSDYIFAGGRRLAAASTDDILNPGFEEGMEGWRSWAGDSSASEQVITDATRAHSGNNYLQLSTTTTQVWTMNEAIAVNPGDQLTFGGWVYLEPGSATGGYVGWNLVVLDANGNALGFPAAANVTPGAWSYQSVTYTVPSGGASVALYPQIIQPTGLTTARFDDGFLTGASGPGVHYYHADDLGSARLMTDGSGNQTWSATYLPFGQEWNPQPTTNHYKFTGKERDTESGNDNFAARYYSSNFGRFMSPDPENAGATAEAPQSWNAYAYVLGNPLNYTDPFGLDCIYKRDAPDNPYPGAPGTVTILRGDCANKGGKDDSGVFVDGRIDTDSPIVNDPRTGNLNFGLSKGAGYGTGVALGFYAPQAQPQPDELTDDQVTILSLIYKDARIVDSGPKWLGCTAAGALLGDPPSLLKPITHLTIKAAEKAAESPATATLAARAYHTASDARFTAWGKYSKVLVPRTAKALSPALHVGGKFVGVAGWALLAKDAYEAGKTCNAPSD